MTIIFQFPCNMNDMMFPMSVFHVHFDHSVRSSVLTTQHLVVLVNFVSSTVDSIDSG